MPTPQLPDIAAFEPVYRGYGDYHAMRYTHNVRERPEWNSAATKAYRQKPRIPKKNSPKREGTCECRALLGADKY